MTRGDTGRRVTQNKPHNMELLLRLRVSGLKFLLTAYKSVSAQIQVLQADGGSMTLANFSLLNFCFLQRKAGKHQKSVGVLERRCVRRRRT